MADSWDVEATANNFSTLCSQRRTTRRIARACRLGWKRTYDLVLGFHALRRPYNDDALCIDPPLLNLSPPTPRHTLPTHAQDPQTESHAVIGLRVSDLGFGLWGFGV